MGDDHGLDQAMRDLVSMRGGGKTICPSEVARAVGGEDWRRLMKQVRARAVALAQAGEVMITRKGKVVDPADFKGVYRIGGVARNGGGPAGEGE